jgi:signal transduction histidine kinase
VHRAERRKARIALERMQHAHAVERERSRIAQDIHDDIGASLTQIALLSDRVDGARHDPAEVEQWNRRVAQTAQHTIRSLDEIVWAVSPKHDTLESLANYLGRFAQEHLELAGVRCRLEIPTILPTLALDAEVRHNLFLATREVLQNIVAHARASQATLALELRDGKLEIRIADNGPGFDLSSAPAQGNGLANIRLRMHEINGEATITSTPGAGTRVELTVPRVRLFSERATAARQATPHSVAP